jgi:hypothetical protein
MSYYRFDNSYMLDVIGERRGPFGESASSTAAPDMGTGCAPSRRAACAVFASAGARIRRHGSTCPHSRHVAMGRRRRPRDVPAHQSTRSPRSTGCAGSSANSCRHRSFARIGADGEIREADLDRLCASAPRLTHVRSRHSMPSAETTPYGLAHDPAADSSLQPAATHVGNGLPLPGAERAHYQVKRAHHDRLDKVSAADREWLLGKRPRGCSSLMYPR